MAQFYSAKRREPTRKIITVTVTDLDHFGQGVAAYQGKTLFIRDALPGEEVEVRLTEDKRHYANGEVTRRLNESAERVTPRCPHFAKCGGCQMQHINIERQQAVKSQALGRMMGSRGQPRQVNEIISGPAWGYRRRARLGLHFDAKARRLQMGFRQSSDKALVSISECPVLVPQLEALIKPVHALLSALSIVNRLGHVEFVLADNGPLMVLRHLAPLSHADRQLLEQFSHTHQLAIYLAADSENLEPIGQQQPWCHSDGLRLSFSPRDFIQVNDVINQQMVSRAIAWLDIQPGDRVLDLFCGMGNFTLPLAKRAAQVVGIEGVAALVAKAQYNAQYNSLKNVTFFHENLDEDVTRQPWAKQGFDKILMDPARAGAAGVLQHIIRLAPQKVVYVSCNHATLARDSEAMLAAGYHITSLAMLDMFPHTGHLESMALFERS